MMFQRFGQFAALDSGEKLVFVQAWLLLGYFRAAILAGSFKRLISSLQHHREVMAPIALTLQQLQQAVQIAELVASAARHTPWQSPCLAQVLTTQRLLARRGIPGQFYLGVRKERGCHERPGGLQAHAWLQCGAQIINGETGHQDYTVVSAFSWGRF